MKKAYDTPQESISYAKNTQGDGFIVQGATLKGVRHTPRIRQIIERKIAQLEKAIQEAGDEASLDVYLYSKSSQIGILREVLEEI
jgi:hypothetical protein